MLPPPIHVAGPSNPLLTPGCVLLTGVFMTVTLIGVGLQCNGCSSADKGQVSSPSAALMGRANSDPSPVEHQLGQSIVSSRVPACLQSDITITAAAWWRSSRLILQQESRNYIFPMEAIMVH